MAERVWEQSFTSRLTNVKPGNPFNNGLNDIPAEELPSEMEVESEEKPLADSPLLMTEPAWNPAKAREKTIEIAMEKWGTPAFYLARNGVLAAYDLLSQCQANEALQNPELTPVTVSRLVKPPPWLSTLAPQTSPSPPCTTV